MYCTGVVAHFSETEVLRTDYGSGRVWIHAVDKERAIFIDRQITTLFGTVLYLINHSHLASSRDPH